jgi:hypothetical protein
MTHYVCTGGCKGVSGNPNATCQAEGCPKHDHPLTPCNCIDGQHRKAYEKTKKLDSEAS